MKRLVCKDIDSFEYKTVETPIRKANEVLIKMNYLGVCGSDIHAYKGNQPFFNYPRVLGHEVSGTVVEADELSEGTKVVVLPYMSCGECIACKNGIRNACETLTVIGVHVDGAMQEYISVPKEYVIPYTDITDRNASMIEPLAISTHAVKRAGVKKGEKALVVGSGPIGIGAAQVIKAEGGEVILADINDEKLETISKKMDVLGTVNPLKEGYREELLRLTDGSLPTLIIDATGNANSMGEQVKYLAHSGRVVFVGLTKGDLKINDIEFHKRETTMYRTRGATVEDFEYVIENLKINKLDAEMLITHEIGFSSFAEGLPKWIEDGSMIKGVIKY